MRVFSELRRVSEFHVSIEGQLGSMRTILNYLVNKPLYLIAWFLSSFASFSILSTEEKTDLFIYGEINGNDAQN